MLSLQAAMAEVAKLAKLPEPSRPCRWDGNRRRFPEALHHARFDPLSNIRSLQATSLPRPWISI